MVAEVDEDFDGQMSFREFLLIFRKAARGELKAEGLTSLAATCNVAEVRELDHTLFLLSRIRSLAGRSWWREELLRGQGCRGGQVVKIRGCLFNRELL